MLQFFFRAWVLKFMSLLRRPFIHIVFFPYIPSLCDTTKCSARYAETHAGTEPYDGRLYTCSFRSAEVRLRGDCVFMILISLTRICSLLEQWINEYPTDFAAAGTAGALSAFIKQILTHTHTLNYGSDFLPFLDLLPSLVDEDAAWAQKFEETTAESDESDSMFGEDNESDDTEVESPTSFSPHPNDVSDSANSPRPPGRERKSSLPLSAKAFLQSTRAPAKEVSSRPSPKDILARLTKASQSLALYDAQTIALEITRRELELFMMIEVRQV